MTDNDLAIAGAELEAETRSVARALAAAHEVKLRSAPYNAFVTLLGVALIGGVPLVGALGTREAAAIVVPVWLLYQAAVVVHHVRGGQGAAYRLLKDVGAVAGILAIHALVLLSETAVTPLWALCMWLAFVSPGSYGAGLALVRAALVVSHATLLLGFLALDDPGAALFTLLVLGASLLVHTMTTRLAAEGVRVQAERNLLLARARAIHVGRERDRLARELHDGVGADVTAIVLQLRWLVAEDTEGDLAEPVQRAEAALAALRELVSTLRRETAAPVADGSSAVQSP